MSPRPVRIVASVTSSMRVMSPEGESAAGWKIKRLTLIAADPTKMCSNAMNCDNATGIDPILRRSMKYGATQQSQSPVTFTITHPIIMPMSPGLEVIETPNITGNGRLTQNAIIQKMINERKEGCCTSLTRLYCTVGGAKGLSSGFSVFMWRS